MPLRHPLYQERVRAGATGASAPDLEAGGGRFAEGQGGSGGQEPLSNARRCLWAPTTNCTSSAHLPPAAPLPATEVTLTFEARRLSPPELPTASVLSPTSLGEVLTEAIPKAIAEALFASTYLEDAAGSAVACPTVTRGPLEDDGAAAALALLSAALADAAAFALAGSTLKGVAVPTSAVLATAAGLCVGHQHSQRRHRCHCRGHSGDGLLPQQQQQ